MKTWHFFILFAISSIVSYFIYDDVRSSAIDYVSGIGSVASIYAIIIAIVELKSVKRVANETNQAVKDKMNEVNQLLSYADVERHIEICSSVNPNLKGEQYEAVAIKLDQLKKILLEIKNNQSITDKSDSRIQTMVMRLGSDTTAVRNKWVGQLDFDNSIVLEHVDEVSTFLQDISAKLKHQTI